MAHKNIIELNGKQYDARTGEVLGLSTKSAQPLRSSVMHRGRVLDGFTRVASPSSATQQPLQNHNTRGAQPSLTVTQKTTPVVSKKHLDVTRPGAKIVTHHPAQKPKTLMRSAVKKPEFKLKTAIKTQVPAEVMAAPIATIVPKKSVTHVSKTRLERAQQTPQSMHVQHFRASQSAAAPEPKAKAIPTAAPSSTMVASSHPQPLARGTLHTEVRTHRPNPQATRSLVAPTRAAAPPRLHAAQPHAHDDIFEAALAHATSHEQTYHKPPKAKSSRFQLKNRRLAAIGASLGTLLLLGGFVAYANMPTIEIRLASANAGFQAKLPGYQPIGYALDNSIQSTSGKVSFSYRSGDSTLNVTQQPSNWDSQTLFENSIALNNQTYKSIQSQGRTIYIYNRGDTASWVNNGIRYDMSGTADLTTDQITNLATSM